MANKEFQKTIYAPATLEFVTVAAQFCVFLEQSSGRSKREFVETMLRLLPLLYVKATLLPRVESDGAFLPDDKVTEADYDFVRQTVYDIMQGDDDYEELVYDATILTDESRWQSAKARWLMEAILAGITIDSSDLQLLKADGAMLLRC